MNRMRPTGSTVLHADTLALRPSPSSTRSAGIAIAAATLVSTIFVALDRSGGGTTPATILAGIARLAGLKALVHGVAMASVCAYAYGHATLAQRLGLQRGVVLAGLATYLFGCMAMLLATLLDGFVTPHVAIDAGAAVATRAAFAFDLVHYLNLILNDLAKLGWVLQGVGTLAWAIVLLQRRGAARVVGGVGLMSSGLVLALLALSATSMSMASLLAVLCAQLLWNLAAGVLLWRGLDGHA
jgi:hypothetical protein